MRSGLEIVRLYEKKFKLCIPVENRRFLIEAIDNALKEVYEIAQDDMVKMAKQLSKKEKKDG